MLQQLHIQNYAIIDELSIDFSGKLNIITGETGAGKSILMGALGLVLGERADSSALWQKEKKCFVEAAFRSDHRAVKDFLKLHELDEEDEIVIRREINSSGKSRAFINDTPVNLTQLKSFASLLVDLHQQFDTLELGEENFQRQVIDALAGNQALLEKFSKAYADYIKAKKELDEWIGQQSNSNKEVDYQRFLFDELEEAGFKENEIEDLEKEIKLLSHAEEIKLGLTAILQVMLEDNDPLVQRARSISLQLSHYNEFHNAIPALAARLHSAQLELDDIASEIGQINDRIQVDSDKLQQANERMSLGYRLLKKHGVTVTSELLSIKEELEKKLEHVLNLTGKIADKEIEVSKLKDAAGKLAADLSAARLKQLNPFEEKVNGLLRQVGMPNASIKVKLETISLSPHGQEDVVFLFDANKTGRFEPLQKVASGGELSRLMLSIKSLVAKSVNLPVLIFDEIDTGISGEAAKQVGLIMKELSGRHQVIAITHQPQIAARADAHYFVYKELNGKAISTSIRLLKNEERIKAIAQMLSGEKPTLAAMENAREMISL